MEPSGRTMEPLNSQALYDGAQFQSSQQLLATGTARNLDEQAESNAYNVRAQMSLNTYNSGLEISSRAKGNRSLSPSPPYGPKGANINNHQKQRSMYSSINPTGHRSVKDFKMAYIQLVGQMYTE